MATHVLQDQARGGGAGGDCVQSGGFGGSDGRYCPTNANRLSEVACRIAITCALHLARHAPASGQAAVDGESQQGQSWLLVWVVP